jgi:hypothetical protein
MLFWSLLWFEEGERERGGAKRSFGIYTYAQFFCVCVLPYGRKRKVINKKKKKEQLLGNL